MMVPKDFVANIVQNQNLGNMDFLIWLIQLLLITSMRLVDLFSSHKWAQELKRPGYKIEFKLISLDENIGKLFDKLKAENLYDDSIIIFTTDNGANIATYGSSK